MLFYGDSIFESLRGTDKCRSCDNIYSRSSCKGAPAALLLPMPRSIRDSVQKASRTWPAHPPKPWRVALARLQLTPAPPARPPTRPGVPDVLKKYFGRMNPGVMSMSMDQTANLLWRLDNGQIPAKNKASRGACGWLERRGTYAPV